MSNQTILVNTQTVITGNSVRRELEEHQFGIPVENYTETRISIPANGSFTLSNILQYVQIRVIDDINLNVVIGNTTFIVTEFFMLTAAVSSIVLTNTNASDISLDVIYV